MNDTTVLDEYNNPVIIHTKKEFKNEGSRQTRFPSSRLHNSFCKRKITTSELDKLCHDI